MEDDSSSVLTNAFGSLITNDKEHLVDQLVNILRTKDVDPITARFYLDMTNWNVQNAVGAFYDNGCQLIHTSAHNFQFLRDITIGEGESIQPNTPFTKTWLVCNPGPQPWPNNCYLKFVSGDHLSANTSSVRVPPLLPGQQHEISVDMRSPDQSSNFAGQWRMFHGGYFFGEPIWVVLEVSTSGILGMLQKMEGCGNGWSNNNKHQVAAASASTATASTSTDNNQKSTNKAFKNPFLL